MTRVDYRKLQRLIDRATEANNAAYLATEAVNDYCEQVYGAVPGELDVDEIIDGCLGGSGMSRGMTAKSFHEAMTEAMK